MTDEAAWKRVTIGFDGREYPARQRREQPPKEEGKTPSFWCGPELSAVIGPEDEFRVGDATWEVQRKISSGWPQGGQGAKLVAERSDVPW